MTKRLIALSASLGLLGAAAVHAQTTTTPTQPQATPPATTSPQPTNPPVGVPPSPQMQAPKSGTTATAPSTSKTQFLAKQEQGQMLASEYMNKSILGANNQRIGDVNDLLLSQEGDVVAVLVGVGGFLGIGEKTVALPFDSLKRSPEANQLTTNFSREQLEQAPTFVTTKSERSGTGTGSSTGGTKR